MNNPKPARRSGSPRSSSPRATSPRTRRVEKLHGLKEKVQKALAEQKQAPLPSNMTESPRMTSLTIENSDVSSPTGGGDGNICLVQSVKSRFESNSAGKPQAFAQMDNVTKENRTSNSGRSSPRNTSAIISAAVFGDGKDNDISEKPKARPVPKRASMSMKEISTTNIGIPPTNIGIPSALSPRPQRRTSPRKASSLRENGDIMNRENPPSASSSSPPEAVIGVEKSDMEKRRAAFEPNKFTEAESNKKIAENQRLSKWTMLTSAFETGKFKAERSSKVPIYPVHDLQSRQDLIPPSPPKSVRQRPVAPSSAPTNSSSSSKGFPRQDAKLSPVPPPPLNPNAKFITPTTKSISHSNKKFPSSDGDKGNSQQLKNNSNTSGVAAWYSAPPPPTSPPSQNERQAKRQVDSIPPPPPSADEEILLLTPPSGEKTENYGINMRSPIRKDFVENNHIFKNNLNNVTNEEEGETSSSSKKGVKEQIEERNKLQLERKQQNKNIPTPSKNNSSNEERGGAGGGASAADVAAVSVAVVAEYNRRLALSEESLKEAEETSADLASRLEDALAREDELVRRLQKHPMTPPRNNNTPVAASPDNGKHQYADLLEGYKAAATAAREDAEAARRDAENSRLEAKRREEAVTRQEYIINGKIAEISRENEELKDELYKSSQELAKTNHEIELSKKQSSLRNGSDNNNSGSNGGIHEDFLDITEANRNISKLEKTCLQLEEALEQERLNHREYVMSTHSKFTKICEEKANADVQARSLEVRLQALSQQCDQLAHEKDVAISALERNNPQKMETEVRNAVMEARREAQVQHSSVTNQLEKLRLEAETEAAQAHEMLASETAALKATRRELDELLSESAKSSRHIAEMSARVKRLEEDVEFSDNRADEAEEKMREMRNEMLMNNVASNNSNNGESDRRDSSFNEKDSSEKNKPENKKKESRWGSAINSVVSMRSKKSFNQEKRQDNHWIQNVSNSNNDQSSISQGGVRNSPPSTITPWQTSSSNSDNNAPPEDLEITVVDSSKDFTSPGGGGQNKTNVQSASKLNSFLQGSPNDRGGSCPRPITPEKKKPAVIQRKASMTLADFMKVMPAEKAAKR